MSTSCHVCAQIAAAAALPSDQLIVQWPHSLVLLAPWQYYTGYCIVVSRVHATELFELTAADRHGLLEEVTSLARTLHQEFRPRKINYELLGNQVPHIHWHIIPRYESDPQHLQPAWLALDQAERDSARRAQLLGSVDREEVAARIRQALPAR
jgi:diadenosine tetraphosphate (Ap4A) HIT family hydrolase